MGLGVFERFDVVVDLYRNHPRLFRNVAADHQHDAEFAHCMGKAEDGAGQEAGPGERHRHRPEAVPRAGAQGGGHFQRPVADGFEGVLDGLHDEGTPELT